MDSPSSDHGSTRATCYVLHATCYVLTDSLPQDWENNASRALSLRKELELVTQIIIQWRKLELRSANPPSIT